MNNLGISLYSYPPFIAGFSIFLLGLFVFFHNRKERLNQIFSLMCLSIFLWLGSYSVVFSSNNKTTALFWARFSYLGIVFIPITVNHTTSLFLKIKSKKNDFIINLSYVLGFFFLLLSRTDYFFFQVKRFFWGFYPQANFAYPLFLLFFLIYYGRGLLFLTMYLVGKLKNVDYSPRKHIQIKYVFWAIFIAALASVDYIAKFNFEFYPLGYLFMLVYVLILAYAIVTHQLMDIEVIIKKTLVFAGLFIVSYGVFAGIAYLGSTLFEKLIYNKWIAMIPSVVVIVLILRPLENFLRNVTDKYLFQKKYDYRDLLRTFSDDVLTVLGLKDLVEMTVNKLAETVKLSSVEMFLFDDEEQEFTLAATTAQEPGEFNFAMNSPFILYMKETEKYLYHEGMGRGEATENKVIGFPEALHSSLIIPLLHNQELLGFLSLGKKKSDEEYSQDDIDILIPLAKTISIAIANARLFSELTKAHAQAAQREKMAVIGTLSAGINHEICNPLGIARGQCELFLLNYSEGVYKDKSSEELIEKAQEIMGKVIHETDRATVITRKLSSFAKPAKGELTSDVDVEDEMDEVISLLEHELKLANVEIVKNCQEGLPMIEADRKQLQEVFFNIIRNGAQAISGSGTITIDIAHANNKVQIDIMDTGSGIKKKVQDRIFDPFFTTKEPGKGTGLGLFLVKQIVERNNGSIFVNSEIGKGTTFSMVFKAAETE